MNWFQIISGVASIVALLYALAPNLLHQEVKHRNIAWVAVALFLGISIILHYANNSLSENIIEQQGQVEISNRISHQHQVFYPQSFINSPNLNIKFIKGGGLIGIIEQNAVGFIFEAKSVSYSGDGAHIEWVAKGSAKH